MNCETFDFQSSFNLQSVKVIIRSQKSNFVYRLCFCLVWMQFNTLALEEIIYWLILDCQLIQIPHNMLILTFYLQDIKFPWSSRPLLSVWTKKHTGTSHAL